MKYAIVLLLMCAVACTVSAQVAPAPQPGKSTTRPSTSRAWPPAPVQPPIPALTISMNLWPEQVPYAAPATQPERDDGTGRIWNVSVPGILVYLPPEPPPTGGRTAIIACPGGGYTHLTRLVGADGLAGTFVPRGVAVIALKYRLKPPSTDVEADALADGRRAMRLVRAHAAEWGINPHRIGMLGASAGANLSLNLATHPDKADSAADEVDRQSDRPDFIALLSPWPNRHVVDDYPVTTGTAPAFICTALDDTAAAPAFALKLAAAYADAKVPVNIWVVDRGGHAAFTVGGDTEGAAWPDRFWEWLGKRGFIEPQ